MKVILINGSPNKNGCTDRALREVKYTLEENKINAEIFWIGKKVQGCTACGKCKESGHCIFNDVVNEFAKNAKDADGFIFGSPVYYGGPSGSLVCFMNRLFYAYSKYFQFKPVASVVSCRRGGASETFSVMNMHYLMNNMIVIGSQYWNQVHGNTADQVKEDLEGLQTMRTLGSNMAWVLKNNSLTELPIHETPIKTNYIR